MGLAAGGVGTATFAWVISGLFRWVPSRWVATILVAFGALVVLRDLKIISFRLPQNSRQVPRDVFQKGVIRAAVRFGFELGTGVRTYLSAGAPYVLALALVLADGGLLMAFAAGVGFGLGRAAMPLFRSWSEDADNWDRLAEQRLRWIVPTSSFGVTVVLPWLATGPSA